MKKKSALYAYIEPVLQTGSEEDIKKAKEQYWKDYRKQFNKVKYKECTCIKITLTPVELKMVTTAAKAHGISRTAFIKLSALAKSRKGSIIDTATIARVRELFVLHYTHTEQMLEEQEPIHPDHLLQQVSELEAAVLKIIQVVTPNTDNAACFLF